MEPFAGGPPMSDPLSWSFNLGRWAGTRIRVHLFLVLYAGLMLLMAASAKGHPVLPALAWLGLLLLALVCHELGHSLMAARLGMEREEVRIWPLGNMVAPSTSAASRSSEAVFIALAGPAASLAMALIAAIGLGFTEYRMEFNPFSGHEGAPVLAGSPDHARAAALSTAWYLGCFGFLNWVIFLANLIPALPMDMGRVLRGVLAHQSKDGLLATYTARAFAVVLALVGVYRFSFNRPGALVWIGLAVLIEWMVRLEIRMFEEVGFFDDSGVFGYDFSQGYASLEAGASMVRPKPESALKRWRRRRSEQRRQRREAQEAAEERRMDEILLKIHHEGRASLTDEENRFLVRVSVKIRNRRVRGS